VVDSRGERDKRYKLGVAIWGFRDTERRERERERERRERVERDNNNSNKSKIYIFFKKKLHKWSPLK
jgi:hypothetical protein